MTTALYVLAFLLVGSGIVFSERVTVKTVLVALAGVAFLIGSFIKLG